jgi:hypothetical protein
VKTQQGLFAFYWVEFDERHRDSDGDGPYASAEIDGRYLIPVSTA